MANRTRSGSLQLTDLTDPDQGLIISNRVTGVSLLAIDRRDDRHVEVHLGDEGLELLAQEIDRIRRARRLEAGRDT